MENEHEKFWSFGEQVNRFQEKTPAEKIEQNYWKENRKNRKKTELKTYSYLAQANNPSVGTLPKTFGFICNMGFPDKYLKNILKSIYAEMTYRRADGTIITLKPWATINQYYAGLSLIEPFFIGSSSNGYGWNDVPFSPTQPNPVTTIATFSGAGNSQFPMDGQDLILAKTFDVTIGASMDQITPQSTAVNDSIVAYFRIKVEHELAELG
jgi:hypothetical protein